jgi:hypothetical protein
VTGRRYADLGRDHGLAAGLAAVLDGLDPAASAPNRLAVLPAAASLPAGAHVLPNALAARDGLAVVRFEAAGAPAGTGRGLTGRRAAALAAVRLGVLSRLLDQAVTRLAGRHFGGVPLIEQQLVAGTVADVVAGIELWTALHLDDAPADVTAAQHERLTDADWAVTRLFGAEGYIADHPVRSLYMSTLVADVWVARKE